MGLPSRTRLGTFQHYGAVGAACHHTGQFRILLGLHPMKRGSQAIRQSTSKALNPTGKKLLPRSRSRRGGSLAVCKPSLQLEIVLELKVCKVPLSNQMVS